MNKPEWLKRDVLADMEKVFNKDHYSQFNNIENALSMREFMKHNLKVTDYYKRISDTYFSISWNNFKELIEKNGFKLALLDSFEAHNKIEQFGIWAWKEKGLLLKATSYCDSLNEGEVYGQAKRLPHYIKEFFPINCSCGYKEDVAVFSKDVREGLFLNIKTIEEDMELLKVWNDYNSFLWLLDYTQTKIEGYDYKEINKERLSRCPQFVKDMVRFKERYKETK